MLEFLRSIGTLAVVVVTLLVVRRLLDRREAKLSGYQFRNQIRNIEPWVCKALNLHWILVNNEGSIEILTP